MAEARVLLSGVTAVHDSAFVGQQQNVAIDVTANDVGGGTVTAVSDASAGQVSLGDDGRITYRSDNPYFSGVDTFTYTVTSGGVSDTATVSVQVGSGVSRPTIGSNGDGAPSVTTAAGFTPDVWTGFDGRFDNGTIDSGSYGSSYDGYDPYGGGGYAGGSTSSDAPIGDYSYVVEYENWLAQEDGTQVQGESDFLTVISSVDDDGSWTYSEVYVTGLGLADGTSGDEGGSWGGDPLGYTFTASADSSGATTYTLIVSEDTTFTSDDGALTVSSWTNYTVATATSAAGVVTTTNRFGNTGYDLQFSITEDYEVDGDAVGGDTDGSAGGSGDGDDDSSIDGSGTYTATLREGYELIFTLDTLTYHLYSDASFSFDESGTISGEDGSGTYTAGGGSQAKYDYTMNLAMGADGEFHLTGGSGTSLYKDGSYSTYSYDGAWSGDAGSDDDSSGTYGVWGSSEHDLSLSTTSMVTAGVWVIEGEGSYSDSADSGFSFTAEGTYAYAMGDGNVSGTWDQSGSSEGAYSVTMELSLAENPAGDATPPTGDEAQGYDLYGGYDPYGGGDSGASDDDDAAYAWVVDSGVYSDDYVSNFDFSYKGSGTYTRDDESSAGDGFTISGTIAESGGEGFDASGDLTVDLVSGAFIANADYSERSKSSFSYEGGGSISRDEMTGTVTESGLAKDSSNLSIQSQLTDADEEAKLSGGGSSSSSGNSSFEIVMSGSITMDEMSGTASFDEGTTSDYSIDVAFTINEDSGEFDLDSLVMSIGDSAWRNESYDVAGSITRGTLSGTAFDSVASGFTSDFSLSLGEDDGEGGTTDTTSVNYSAYDRADSGHDLSSPKEVDHSGGTLAGTEHDNATAGHNMTFAISSSFEDGAETQSGNLTSTAYSTSDVGYSVRGSITGGGEAYGEGGGLTGTASENQNETVTTNSSVIFEMGNSGDWNLVEAIVSMGVTLVASSSENLSGPYTSGQLTGTQSDSSHYTYTAGINLVGTGTPAGGDGGGGGEGTGEGGDDSAKHGEDNDDPFALDWSYAGTGSTSLIAGASGNKSASGSISSGFMSGTASESSQYSVTSNRSTQLEYVQGDSGDELEQSGGGTWETIGGSGSSIIAASGDFSGSLSGTDDSGDISLTVSASSSGDYTLNQATGETYNAADDEWDRTGTETTAANFNGSDSTSGNGSYTAGGMSMTMRVDDSSSYGGGMTQDRALNEDGEWETTAATNSINVSISSDTTASGSGSYSTVGAGVMMNGSRSTSTSNNMTASFNRQGTWTPGSEGESVGSWAYTGGGSVSGGSNNSNSQTASGSWSETFDSYGGGGGSIGGNMSQSSSDNSSINFSMTYGVDGDGGFEIGGGTISIGGGSTFNASSDATGTFTASGMDSGLLAYTEDMTASGSTSIDIQIRYSDGDWDIISGLIGGGTRTSLTTTLAGGGTWSSSWGNADAGGTMSGSATYSSSQLVVDESSFNSTYNGSDWDQSTSASGSTLSDTQAGSIGNGSYWHVAAGIPITGTMNQMSNNRTVVQTSYVRETQNGVTTQDERHSMTTVTRDNMSTSTGTGSHSWAYAVGHTNVSGNEFVLETQNSESDSTTITTVDTVLGQTTTRKHETWNHSSDSSFEYNRSDHSDWDYSYTDNYGTEYESEGFTHNERSAHSSSNSLSFGNRTTTTSGTGTVVQGSQTVNNSANGGWDSSYNSRSRSKTTWPGSGDGSDPYGGDYPETWEETESTGNGNGNVSWSLTQNMQTDYASGLTTGDIQPNKSVSGGGSELGKYRYAWDNGYDGPGGSGDSGLQTMYEYSWDATDGHYGEAPGTRAGLQSMPARGTGGGPLGEGQGAKFLDQAGPQLGGMLGGPQAMAGPIAEDSGDSDASSPSSDSTTQFVSAKQTTSDESSGMASRSDGGNEDFEYVNGYKVPNYGESVFDVIPYVAAHVIWPWYLDKDAPASRKDGLSPEALSHGLARRRTTLMKMGDETTMGSLHRSAEFAGSYPGQALDIAENFAIEAGMAAIPGPLDDAIVRSRLAGKGVKSLAPNRGKPPIVGPVRPYDEATKARIPGYDNHHLDPKLGRVDPDYPKGPTIGVRNDNAGGRVPGGVNLHTAKGGFQTALNDHIKKDLGFTIKQWNDLPDATHKLHLRRYYASLGIPFPF